MPFLPETIGVITSAMQDAKENIEKEAAEADADDVDELAGKVVEEKSGSQSYGGHCTIPCVHK